MHEVNYPEIREIRTTTGRPSPWRTSLRSTGEVCLIRTAPNGEEKVAFFRDLALEQKPGGGYHWTAKPLGQKPIPDMRIPDWVLKRVTREIIRWELRQVIPPGTTVYTRLDYAAKSGMRRVITPIIITGDCPLYYPEYVALLLDAKRDEKYGGIVCSGCGMDMGFNLVYHLSVALYPGERGGYALHHRWI